MSSHDDERDRSDLGLAWVPEPGEHECDDGWLPVGDALRPCPTCRPHLIRTTDRNGVTAWRTRPTSTRQTA